MSLWFYNHFRRHWHNAVTAVLWRVAGRRGRAPRSAAIRREHMEWADVMAREHAQRKEGKP